MPSLIELWKPHNIIAFSFFFFSFLKVKLEEVVFEEHKLLIFKVADIFWRVKNEPSLRQLRLKSLTFKVKKKKKTTSCGLNKKKSLLQGKKTTVAAVQKDRKCLRSTQWAPDVCGLFFFFALSGRAIMAFISTK